MSKLKSRFKKALFAFFKDEILNSVGYTGAIQQVQIVTKELKFTEIKSEILLDERDSQRYGEPIGIVYEKALENAKRRLFEESLKFIQVDEKSIMDSHIYPHRAIRVSLFVGSQNGR